MIPSIGRIVLYCLRDSDAGAINHRRQNARTHINELRGNSTGVMVQASITVAGGDTYPMIITRIWPNTEPPLVNGTVMLDGSDTFWATSVGAGEPGVGGVWIWPPRQ
jgi:hypothetical protein